MMTFMCGGDAMFILGWLAGRVCLFVLEWRIEEDWPASQ
jgi:hypothetical protein